MSVIIDEKSEVSVVVVEVNKPNMKDLFRKAAILCVLQNVFFEDKSEQMRDSVTLHDNISEKTNADSLESVEAIMKIEEYFDITIPEEEAIELVTLDKVLTYIEVKVKDFIHVSDSEKNLEKSEKKKKFYTMLNENVSDAKKGKEKLFENAELFATTDEDKQVIERLRDTKGDFQNISELIDESIA